jgi:hypothetical protein
MHKLKKIDINCQIKTIDLLKIKGGTSDTVIILIKKGDSSYTSDNDRTENEYPDDGTDNPDTTKEPITMIAHLGDKKNTLTY